MYVKYGELCPFGEILAWIRRFGGNWHPRLVLLFLNPNKKLMNFLATDVVISFTVSFK